MGGGVLRVLALEVSYRGFAFAVLEGPEKFIDWGNKTVSGDISVFLGKLEAILDRYRPDLVAVEEPAFSGKGGASKERMVWAEQFAADRDFRVVVLRRSLPKREDQAMGVARLFPELAPHLPARRSPWESEGRSLPKFVAIERALQAIEHFERQRSQSNLE